MFRESVGGGTRVTSLRETEREGMREGSRGRERERTTAAVGKSGNEDYDNDSER